jgi:hypothetical protein
MKWVYSVKTEKIDSTYFQAEKVAVLQDSTIVFETVNMTFNLQRRQPEG